MLTAVISFRNEGVEVERTVASIRETAGSAVSVHLIDDGSNDGFDYAAIANQFSCRLDRFEPARGPAINRNFGVDQAETPYVILLDAHMRFYQHDWASRVIQAIQNEPRALYCSVSRPLNPDGQAGPGAEGYGAWLGLGEKQIGRAYLAEWNIQALRHTAYPSVPLPLGATYAFDAGYFQDIGGYVGLKQYGGEEAFAGMKSWMMGRGCRVIRDVTIGHIYKDPSTRGWQMSGRCYLYNRLMMVGVLFGEAELPVHFERLSRVPGFSAAYADYIENQAFIKNLRAFVQDQAQSSAEDFMALNAAFCRDHMLEAYLEAAP